MPWWKVLCNNPCIKWKSQNTEKYIINFLLFTIKVNPISTWVIVHITEQWNDRIMYNIDLLISVQTRLKTQEKYILVIIKYSLKYFYIHRYQKIRYILGNQLHVYMRIGYHILFSSAIPHYITGAVMVVIVWFTTTSAISAYHHLSCEFESRSGQVYSIQHYVVFKVCQWLATGRLFSPDIKHHNTNPHYITSIYCAYLQWCHTILQNENVWYERKYCNILLTISKKLTSSFS
jgi:hypothetical protein